MKKKIAAFALAASSLLGGVAGLDVTPAAAHSNSCHSHSSCGTWTVSFFADHVQFAPVFDKYTVKKQSLSGFKVYDHTDLVYCGH